MGNQKRKHPSEKRADRAKQKVDQHGENETQDPLVKGTEYDFAVISVYSVAVFGLYAYTMYPTISGGDSGELMAAAHELGVAHPPGYPLFTMMSWLAIKLIPIGNMTWRLNLLNAAFAAAAAFLFALTIYRYTGSVGCSVAGASLWCLCKLTWTWSAMAEVFGLNNLFLAALLYLMVHYEQTPHDRKVKTAKLGSLLCGLSLCNQHTMVVYVAIVAMWVIHDLHTAKLMSWHLLVMIGLHFLLGLVPYLYLPVSAFFIHGRWGWGDQRSVEGFLKHLLREEYGTFSLAKTQNHGTDRILIPGLRAYGVHMVTEFTVIAVVLIMVGVVEGIRRWKKSQYSLLVAIVMCIVYLVLFSSRANLNIDVPLLLGVVERFWMQSDCVVVLLASVGLCSTFRYIKMKFTNLDVFKLELAVAVAVIGFQLQSNLAVCNQRSNTVVAEFGDRLMDNFPPNSLVLTKGDLACNVLRYLYLVENKRVDMDVFDQGALTYRWSVPMLRDAYPNITFPGHHMYKADGLEFGTKLKEFSFISFLNSNYHRPIIACIGVGLHETFWASKYRAIPFGPCFRLQKINEPLNLDDDLDLSLNISDGWPYPYGGFDKTSWERVATNEMWKAKINFGLYLYDMAGRTNNVKEKTTLYLKSYEIYQRTVAPLKTEDTPAHFHKNFGVVCEKLLGLRHDINKTIALEESIHHFQMYVEKAEQDEREQVVAVQNLIGKLKGYRGKKLL